jgi:hypothetical protein
VFALTINLDVVAATGRIIVSNLYTYLAKPDEINKKKKQTGLPNEKRLSPQDFQPFFFRLRPS